MYTREASTRMGERVLVRVGKMAIVCKISDHRKAWGTDQFLVAPAEGRGEEWVTGERILVEKDDGDE
jgi:hypothetical protein